MIIGEKIFEFRFRSFFMSGSLVCKMLVLFLRFSRSGWVSLDIGEGVLRILSFGSEPKLLGLDEISDDFAYPIQSSNELIDILARTCLLFTSILFRMWKIVVSACISILEIVVLAFWSQRITCP